MNHLPAIPDPSQRTVVERPYGSPEPAPASMAQQAKSKKEPSLILEYLHTLGRGWKTILVCAPLGLLAAFIINTVSTPLYRTRTSLDVQALSQNLLSSRTGEPTSEQMAADGFESYIQTQIKLLESDTVIHMAVQKMKVSPGQVRPRPGDGSALFGLWKGTSMKRNELIDDAVNRLKVRPLGAARLIELTCESPDPAVAAEFCNTLSETFMKQNLDTRNETALTTSEWLSKQLADVKERLAESEKELQQEAQKSELLFANGRESVAETRLRELESELSRAQAERMIRQAQYQTALNASQNGGPSSAESQNSREMQLRLAELRRQLAELSNFTDEYYKVKKIKAQIAEIESGMRQEHTSTLARMKNDLNAAQQREDMLQSTYHKQEAIVGAQLGATAHYELLKASVESQRQLIQTLTQRVKEAGFATAMRSSSIQVVDPAVAPRIPVSPRRLRNLAIGLVLGCIGGFGLVLFRNRTDPHLRLPGDAMQALNLWELGVIPAAAADKKAFGRELGSGLMLAKGGHKGPVALMNISGGSSLMADAYRSTMSSLLVRMSQSDKGSVFIFSSPSANEGKTTVVSNLGIAFAEARRRVLLIDGDMQRPSLHKIFDLNNTQGLRDALRGEVNIEKTPIGLLAQPTSVPRLFVMPAGSGHESPVGLLHSQELINLLDRVRREFDVILIDTPPMLHMADARLLARRGDGVVLVVRSGSTTAEEAVTAQYMFQQDFTPVIGVVLNDFHPAREAKYRYYKSYHQYQQKS